METKVNAVVLRAADYGENDKILTLLTAEAGKLTAGIKGVKKAGAKLKFAAQPFCFAEYILVKRGDKHTVINASEIESFYDLRLDVCKFYAASAAVEAADALTYEGDSVFEGFNALVKTLSEICTGNERQALISYLIGALRRSGYGFTPDCCPVCGKNLSGDERLRFDMDTGAFTCNDCGDGVAVSRVTYNMLRKTDGKDYNAEFISDDGEKRALRLLREYTVYKTEAKCLSLSEYIRLL